MPLTQPFHLPWPLTVGDHLPRWRMPSTLGREVVSDDLAGRPLVLLFFGAGPLAALQTELASYAALMEDFKQAGANVIGVLAAGAERVLAFATQHPQPFVLLADEDGAVTTAHHAYAERAEAGGPPYAPARTTFVADANLRVTQRFDAAASPVSAAQVLAALQAHIAATPPAEVPRQAPVLLVANVIPPAFCQELIDLWATAGNEDSGFMRQVEGQTVGRHDYSHKIRRDHFLMEGPLRQRLMYALYHRVKPEIQKAFNFTATRFEDFRIACYDAQRGGYFRPHRDNTTDGTAHRVFALSLNLNAGEYEGGYLRFPEYGPQLYRPGVGEAVIFSCSLLHEATDVIAGRRFVALTFLYGEQEAAQREAYARRAGNALPQ